MEGEGEEEEHMTGKGGGGGKRGVECNVRMELKEQNMTAALQCVMWSAGG